MSAETMDSVFIDIELDADITRRDDFPAGISKKVAKLGDLPWIVRGDEEFCQRRQEVRRTSKKRTS